MALFKKKTQNIILNQILILNLDSNINKIVAEIPLTDQNNLEMDLIKTVLKLLTVKYMISLRSKKII
jgi:hypothetical protein